jgi:hypothetical protein
MNPIDEYQLALNRRHFFGKSACSIGTAALASLLNPQLFGATTPASGSSGGGSQVDHGILGKPHFAAKAKKVIYLSMNGGPSQLDTFDYKPKLNDLFNKDLPESIRKGQRITTMTSTQERLPLAPSLFKFKQYGKSGAWVSELFPHFSKVVDDVALVRTVHTEAINHDPACTFVFTGSQIPGRPTLGAWLSYGLGSENANLPAFVVMHSSWSGQKTAQAVFSRLWGAGWLPSRHQGVAFRSQGDPVLYLSNPHGVSSQSRRQMLDGLAALNRQQLAETGDPEVSARIAQYEMAFRMQTSVPDLMNMSQETKQTLEMYGPEVTTPGTFAYNCLVARRLVERDVRFVQIFHRGWDQHLELPSQIRGQSHDVDQPMAALIQDLKARGLLDDTLVVWGGEFGRTVYCQGRLTKTNYGRDHHPRCYTMWMAGGGIRGGTVYGETDDFSYNIVKDPVHIHDLNATILHCLGIEHKRLTFRFQGRDFRLTDVEGTVVKGILA